jgi:rhodanese-related sulfurtransferase
MRLHLRYVFLTVCLVFGLAAIAPQFARGDETPSSPKQSSAPELSVQELQKMMQKEGTVLLYDVRQPEEFNEGHIKGAILMPLGDLPARYKEIPQKKKIVVYCRSGRRSAQAVAFLRAHGYPDAVSLAGGYLEWSRAQESGAK